MRNSRCGPDPASAKYPQVRLDRQLNLSLGRERLSSLRQKLSEVFCTNDDSQSIKGRAALFRRFFKVLVGPTGKFKTLDLLSTVLSRREILTVAKNGSPSENHQLSVTCPCSQKSENSFNVLNNPELDSMLPPNFVIAPRSDFLERRVSFTIRRLCFRFQSPHDYEKNAHSESFGSHSAQAQPCEV